MHSQEPRNDASGEVHYSGKTNRTKTDEPPLCSSRKDPYLPHGRSLEIPRGRGILEAKFLEAMYENKLECPGGRGCETKNLPWREHWYGYFLELHIKWKLLGYPDLSIPWHHKTGGFGLKTWRFQ